MRKVFWCCMAAGVAAAGGFYLAAQYACDHPDSALVRGMASAGTVALHFQPFAGIGAIAGQAPSAGHPEAENGAEEASIPDEPRPVAAEDHAAAEAPAPIVIPDTEDPTPTPAPAQPADAAVQKSVWDPNAVTPESPCPSFMPYCNDDDAPAPHMPSADEPKDPPAKPAKTGTNNDGGCTGSVIINERNFDTCCKGSDACKKKDDSVWNFWMGFFKGCPDQESKKGSEEPSEPAVPSGTSDCQEDVNYHRHYSGCPYTGCPYTGRCYPNPPDMTAPTEATPGKQNKGKEEASEPVAPKKKHAGKKHTSYFKDEGPFRTEGVDTMEFRPSDRSINEYGSGAPL